jgi:16S rRNA (adenine1518-N6/adenine1519-N6)-dimethyltransferase
VLRGAGLRPKKAMGQNFLVAEPIARAIAEACVPDAEAGRAHVVEIGAGTGALTRWLVERARAVVAVEKDRSLVPLLESELGGRAEVLEGDARTVDFAVLLERGPGAVRVLCGNLPYQLTGTLLRRAVDVVAHVDRAVFMVQDEVAQRLAAKPGTDAYGALTVFVQAAYAVRRVLRVPPGAFHPAPEVSSAVVELLPLRPPRAVETDRFRALVRGAFQARRKQLRNAWAGLAPSAESLRAAASKAGVSLEARGETLSVEDYARMDQALSEL